jgi:hypothetical protein
MRATTMLIVSTLVTGAVLGAAVEPVRADDCQGGGRRGRRCSTPPSSSGGKALTARLLAGARRLGPGERIVVPVVYHVIYDTYVPEGPGVEPDDLEHAPPVALVELQTATLNRAFQGTALSFSTAEVDLRSFAPWRGPGFGYPPLGAVIKMIRMLNAERRGVLHVFLMRQDEETAAPPDTRRMFEAFRRPTDGIVMPWDYLPYEPSLRRVEDDLVPLYFYQGETLVHLVGHYLGLLHTYEPWPGEGRAECTTKCAQISDHVHDTPVHIRNPTFPACLVLDTCPYPGRDPVANYMNAEPDVCSNEFTPGQVERMERMVRAFRPYFIVSAPPQQP